MMVWLEKINSEERQYRFYVMNITQTLFGEWCLIREWGRIGSAGGQRMVDYKDTKKEAEVALAILAAQKCRRGYHQRETQHAHWRGPQLLISTSKVSMTFRILSKLGASPIIISCIPAYPLRKTGEAQESIGMKNHVGKVILNVSWLIV